MDLGYRCSLLYKALFEQDEEKEKQTKEEFEKELMEVYGRAIEKFTEMRLRVEFKRADELLIERFEEWLIENNYSESYIRKRICDIKRIFREIGFPTVEKFDEKYGWLPYTAKRHLSNTFYRFQEFLRSSLTEEKKGKGVKRSKRSVFIDVDGDCEVWRDEG